MTNPAKAKGSQFERDVVAALKPLFPKAERRFGAGQQQDKGDIIGVPNVAIECKNLGKITLASVMDETLKERDHAGELFGAAVIKRRGRGACEAYVVMSLEQWSLMALMAAKPAGQPVEQG